MSSNMEQRNKHKTGEKIKVSIPYSLKKKRLSS